MKELTQLAMAYDAKLDGVWIGPPDDPDVFLPRNIIIQLVSALPANPPAQKEPKT